MVYALALGANAVRHEGSSPSLPTKKHPRKLAGVFFYSSWCFISIFFVFIFSDFGNFIVRTPFFKVAIDLSV